MRERLADYRLFFREFRRTFQSTGAVLPSGRGLSRAMASRVRTREGTQRILEIGPGTGPVTNQIVAGMGPADRLDLVELNQRFVEVLRDRLQRDEHWRQAGERIRVLQMPVEQLDHDVKYDVIVSGLPLNNFSCELVEQILAQIHRLAKPGAMLSFFEYVAIRKAKSLFSKPAERRRLAGIEQILSREFSQWQIDRQCVLVNVPPAWVHHLQLPGQEGPTSQPVPVEQQTHAPVASG